MYIDVYFLINFTVDLLAFHLAAVFTKIKLRSHRLMFATLLSSLYACMMIFFSGEPWVAALLSIVSLIIVSYTLVGGIRILRRIKLMVSFFLFLTVIGGIVHWTYGMLSEYFPQQEQAEVHDRRLLILAVLVLLSIGIIRLLFLLFFNSATERTSRLRLEFMGREILLDALVDTGNLLKDPMDMTPVMLIKKKAVSSLFPKGIPDINEVDNSPELKHHVRLIPVCQNGISVIKTGFRPERVFVKKNNRYVETRMTFIIDEENGTFGGYDALVPSCALENI